MKTVLITGATRNTGLAIAKRFAREGYAVAVTSRDLQSAKAYSPIYSTVFGRDARILLSLPR